jgi:hypothetical protein
MACSPWRAHRVHGERRKATELGLRQRWRARWAIARNLAGGSGGWRGGLARSLVGGSRGERSELAAAAAAARDQPCRPMRLPRLPQSQARPAQRRAGLRGGGAERGGRVDRARQLRPRRAHVAGPTRKANDETSRETVSRGPRRREAQDAARAADAAGSSAARRSSDDTCWVWPKTVARAAGTTSVSSSIVNAPLHRPTKC